VAFVVTSGQIMAVQDMRRGSAFMAPTSVQLSSTLWLSYEALWRTQPALRTVVGFLARNVAQLGVDPYRRVSATDRVKLTDHPVARLLEQPHPGTKLTKYRLLNTLMHDLCIYDNAFILKVWADHKIHALLPVPPHMVKIKGQSWYTPEQYEIRGASAVRTVNADEMIHIHGYNPGDPRQGVAPVETLRQILSEEHAATAYRQQLWRNGARVAGYLKRPKDAPKWSEPARDRFRSAWHAQYAGDGPSTGGTPVLEDGMEFVASGVSPKDAQYVEARKLTREEVAVAYHVSPVMIGLMEGATFSNVTELHKMLYQDTLAPYLTQIAQDLEMQLLRDLEPEAAANGTVYIEFNMAEKLRGSFAEQTQALQSAVGGPWMTRAEARAMFNLSEVDDADQLIVPLNVTTGGLASPRDTAPDNPANGSKAPAADVLRRAYERQSRSVLSRMGGADGAASAPTYDAPRWVRELSDDMANTTGLPAWSHQAWAEDVTGRAAERVKAALAGPDPKADTRRVFDDLIREAGA
jgi:HK97 family phage portal protein